MTSNSVTALAQDSLGYIWVGTTNGLNRYNGYHVENFFADGSPNNINDNHIDFLFLDSKKQLWIGTRNGINRYHYGRDAFESVFVDSARACGRPATTMAESPSGELWIGMHGGCIYRYNASDHKLILTIPALIPDSEVQSFIFDSQDSNILWIGYKGVLVKYNLSSQQKWSFPLPEYPGVTNNNVHGILQKGERLFLAAYASGIHAFSIKDERFESYRQKAQADNYIQFCYMDSRGKMWFSANSGIFYFDETSNQLKKAEDDDFEGTVLNLKGTSCLFEDRQHNYWIGSPLKGVEFYSGLKPFGLWQYNQGPNPLSNKSVSAVYRTPEGTHLFGYSIGMDVFDRSGKKQKAILNVAAGSRSSAANGNVWALFQDSEKNVWIGSYTGGLQLFDTHSLNIIKSYNPENSGIQGWDIRAIDQDADGYLWLAVHGFGIARFNTATREFKSFAGVGAGVPNEWTNDVLVDKQNRLWIATYLGVGRRHLRNGKLDVFYFSRENAQTISDNIAHDIFEDSKGRIWIGTNRGLNLYDENTNAFIRILASDGLPSDIIASIEEDAQGHLWVATQSKGLFKFDKEKWLQQSVPITTCIQSYDIADGLQANQFNPRASFKDNKGKMYFGGINGLTIFHPDSIFKNEYKPQVFINSLRLFNNPALAPGSELLEKHISLTESIKLPYDQSVLTFGFLAINFVQPHKNQYAFKMENFDADWYYVATKREATYTNLEPGEYVFRVKASNNDQVWNDEGVSFKITVLPPWWQTIPFRIAAAILLLLAVYGVIWLRTKRVQSQKILLERLVLDKTHELESQNKEVQLMAEKVHAADQSKINFFMNISHEIKTPLTLIVGPVEQLMRSDSLGQEHKQQLDFVHRNAKRLLSLMNQLLDLRTLEANSYKLKVQYGNYVEFCTDIFNSFKFLAAQKNIRYNLQLNALQHEYGWFDRDVLEKVISNLLSNAFKFTPQNGEITLIVNGGKEGYLQCLVKDTGIGFPAEHASRIYERFFSFRRDRKNGDGTGIGLTLVKELLALHKGSIEAQSEENVGTSFTILLSVRREDFDTDEIVDGANGAGALPAPASRDKSRSPAAFDREKETLLLVEDDEDMRDYVISALNTQYNLFVADNGNDAFEIAREEPIDAVLSDIMMPVTDGIALCQLLKKDETTSHLPVLLITAKSSDPEIREGYEAGADAYLTKPFDVDVLRACISNLINSRNKLRTIFSRHSDLIPQEFTNNRSDSAFIQKLIKIIEDNVDNPDLNYKYFVGELGMSKTKLYSKIGSLTGQSINIFIRSIRLTIAKQYLLESDLTISEVSYKVGFTNPNYFSKSFKQQFGVSPKEFIEHQKDRQS